MSTARTARLLEATAPDAFASVLPELDRCDRLSTAWDDAWERLAADHAEYRAKLEPAR